MSHDPTRAGDDDVLEAKQDARPPWRSGCAGVVLLGLAMLAVIAGIFVRWQAADDARLVAEVTEQGELVTVEVRSRDMQRSRIHTDRHRDLAPNRATQYWLEVVAVDGEAVVGPDGRLPVSKSEHEAAQVGDRLDVWRVDDRFVLQRVIANPTPPRLGLIIAGAGLAGLVAAAVLLVRFVRGARAAAT